MLQIRKLLRVDKGSCHKVVVVVDNNESLFVGAWSLFACSKHKQGTQACEAIGVAIKRGEDACLFKSKQDEREHFTRKKTCLIWYTVSFTTHRFSPLQSSNIVTETVFDLTVVRNMQ